MRLQQQDLETAVGILTVRMQVLATPEQAWGTCELLRALSNTIDKLGWFAAEEKDVLTKYVNAPEACALFRKQVKEARDNWKQWYVTNRELRRIRRSAKHVPLDCWPDLKPAEMDCLSAVFYPKPHASLLTRLLQSLT